MLYKPIFILFLFFRLNPSTHFLYISVWKRWAFVNTVIERGYICTAEKSQSFCSWTLWKLVIYEFLFRSCAAYFHEQILPHNKVWDVKYWMADTVTQHQKNNWVFQHIYCSIVQFVERPLDEDTLCSHVFTLP